MNQTIYNDAVAFVMKTLNNVQPHLDKETLDAVNHYLSHSEIEMAFEGLFIEIMKLNLMSDIDIELTLKIATELNLNKESVFDSDFWNKLKQFTSQS